MSIGTTQRMLCVKRVFLDHVLRNNQTNITLESTDKIKKNKWEETEVTIYSFLQNEIKYVEAKFKTIFGLFFRNACDICRENV